MKIKRKFAPKKKKNLHENHALMHINLHFVSHKLHTLCVKTSPIRESYIDPILPANEPRT
jgi:hypothetical protein